MASTTAQDTPANEEAAPSLTEAIQAPLLRLIGEYTAAMETIGRVLTALEPLAAGVPARPAQAPPAPEEPVIDATVAIDVATGNRQALIEFEDALSQITGVQRVALKSLQDDRATFAVTLSSAFASEETAPGFSVVCSWCGRLLTLGGVRVSHGLCPECAAEAAAGRAIQEIPSQPSLVRPRDDALIYLQRAGPVWVERCPDGAGGWVEEPTPYPTETAAHVVLDHVSAQHPDRLVVVSGDGGATLAAGAVRQQVATG